MTDSSHTLTLSDIRHLVDLEHRLTALETRADAAAAALKSQAVEYERRLDLLNNENARILAVQSHSVSSDVYEVQAASWREWRRGVDAAITRLGFLAALAIAGLPVVFFVLDRLGV